MRKILPCFLITYLMFSSLCYAENLDNALIGYWVLDEGKGINIKDSSGNGYHGELLGANEGKWVSDTPRLIAHNPFALEFDGLNDRVDTGQNGTTAFPQEITYSVWVKLRTTEQVQVILNHAVAGLFRAGLVFHTTGSTFHFSVNDFTTTAQADSAPVADVWYHLAGVYDSQKELKGRLYVNGQLQQDADEATIRDLSASAMVIGARRDGTLSTVGIIDEARIYNRALTEREIQMLSAGKTDEPEGTSIDLGPQFSQGKAVVGKVFFDWNGNGKQDYFGPPSLELRRGSSRVAREDFDGDGRQDAGGVS